MAQARQRLALDLDEIERQLKQTQLQSPLSKSDPLAELARIVGQDDPFKSLLGADRRAAQELRGEDASFAAARVQVGLTAEAHPAQDLAASPDDRAPAYAHPHAYEENLEEAYPLQPRRSRRGLITVAVVLGTAIAAVSGALLLRNKPAEIASGEPPIVKAESDPLKVKPENPGGVEIPNQNAQVYQRNGSDKQTRIVNREEQPIDVRQAATPSATSPAAPAGAAAPAPNGLVASLGEPRRVRTVTVRPDGSVVSPEQTATTAEPPKPPAAPPRPSLTRAEPASAPNGATPAPAQAPSAPAPASQPTTTATPSQPPAAARPAPATASNGALAIAPNPPQQPPAAQRTASVAPPRVTDAAETTSAAGAFSVQLSVTTTEETARAQSQALQRKYAGQLGGRTPFIRTAEVNGKTVYRVRVGPLSREDANELCTEVKGAGGNCFVARN